MAFNAEFYDSFSLKYGANGQSPLTLMLAGEYTTSPPPYNVFSTFTLVTGLTGNGQALQITDNGTNNAQGVMKTLGASYARVQGGFRFQSSLTSGPVGITFFNSGTPLATVSVETSGAIGWRNGYLLSGLSASGGSVSANTTHYIEFDIIFNTSTGQVKAWLDGNSASAVLNSTNVNTNASSFNQFALAIQPNGGVHMTFTVSDLYLHFYTSAVTSDTPLFSNPAVVCSAPTADSSVAFAPTAGVLGQDYVATGNTNAPGANELFLRKFTPAVNMTINSVSCIPGATSAGANFKAVIYSDSAGSPNALLSSGTQVTGATSGTTLTGALVTPQALTAGTPYWIGFITDTSVVLQQVDTTTTGSKAANTYGSGAPGTAPAMTTGQPSWLLVGNCTGQAANWPQVAVSPPVGNASYNASSTVAAADLFTMAAMPGSPNVVYSSKICLYGELGAAGARTVNLQQKSGSTTGNGSSAGQTPGTSYGFMTSYFDTDPNTSAQWTAANQNAATAGYDIAS